MEYERWVYESYDEEIPVRFRRVAVPLINILEPPWDGRSVNYSSNPSTLEEKMAIKDRIIACYVENKNLVKHQLVQTEAGELLVGLKFDCESVGIRIKDHILFYNPSAPLTNDKFVWMSMEDYMNPNLSMKEAFEKYGLESDASVYYGNSGMGLTRNQTWELREWVIDKLNKELHTTDKPLFLALIERYIPTGMEGCDG